LTDNICVFVDFIMPNPSEIAVTIKTLIPVGDDLGILLDLLKQQT
jgi:hypothetical protein